MSQPVLQQMIDRIYEIDVFNGLPVPQATEREEACLFNVNCAAIYVHLFDGKVKVSVFSNVTATLTSGNLQAFAYHLGQAAKLEEFARMLCTPVSVLEPSQARLFNRR